MTKKEKFKFVISAIGILGIVLFGVGGLLFKSVYVGATGIILMVVYCIIGFYNFLKNSLKKKKEPTGTIPEPAKSDGKKQQHGVKESNSCFANKAIFDEVKKFESKVCDCSAENVPTLRDLINYAEVSDEYPKNVHCCDKCKQLFKKLIDSKKGLIKHSVAFKKVKKKLDENN